MKLNHDAEHAWHVWMNRRADERAKAGEEREHSLYEFKSLISYLEYGHKQIQEAFEGKLRTTHQHCSHTAPEKLATNVLKCCLGKDVTQCPILLSLRDTVQAEDERRVNWYRDQLKQERAPMPAEEIFKLMSATCGWHIYREATKGGEGRFSVDTSEGYHLDESDRRFWERTYASLAAQDPDDDTGGEDGQR